VIPVLHLRQATGLYGADRAVLALAAAQGEPFAPLIGSIVRPGLRDVLGEEARRRGLRAFRFESAARFDLACARAIARAAAAEGVQLLHAHDFKTVFLAVSAGLRARLPVVATYHGDTASTWQVHLYEAAGRALGNLTRGTAAVSRSLMRKLQRSIVAAPVEFIPNGVAAFAPISAAERERARAQLGVEGYCVAVLGRLSPEKGHAVLIEALRRMEGPPLVLFAGDGPLRAELERKARGLTVRFLGFAEDPRAIYAAADVIALPSLREGLPIVALESLALGACLVASAVGELPEVLSQGAGVLVPPGDAAALAAALAQLRGAEARAGIAERAVQRSRSYDVAAMAGAYASLYARALSLEPMPSSSR
jgi:glycosyltransferase involved in cell wall biosynthesis